MRTGFDPAWLNDCEPQQVYKHDTRSKVWRIDAPDGRAFVVKRFEFNPLRQMLGRLLGLHPGQRECRMAKRLIAAEIPVVPIIASGYQRRGLGIQFWLATPHRGTSLHNLFHHNEISDPDRRIRLIVAVFELTDELIRKAYFNRDHKASNILIDEQDRPWLIDVGAIRPSNSPSLADRMVFNLGISLSDAGATPADLAPITQPPGPDPPSDSIA